MPKSNPVYFLNYSFQDTELCDGKVMRTVFDRQESIYSRFSSIIKKPMKVCSKIEKKTTTTTTRRLK